MSGLDESLRDLERGLTSLGRDVVLGALRRGLPEETVEAGLRARGLDAPESVLEYFAWRDGVEIPPGRAVDDFQVIPGFYAMPFDECVTSYDAFVRSGRWSREWLPLLANGGGDFYLVDISAPEPPVRHFRIDESEHPVEFTSLQRFIAAIADGIRSGAVYVDGEYLEMDDAAFGDVAARLDPDVEWWRS